MARTVVGLMSETAEAEKVVNELVDGGFSRDDISLVAHTSRCGPSLGPVESVSGGGGPGTGAAIGGLAGLVTGIVALAVPGIGPILAAGPIAAELLAGGVGATAGVIIGGLKRMGVSDEDAGCFCEALRRGGILISVATSDERASEAERIIGEHRLVDIDDCAAEWRQSGWKGFDSDAESTYRSEPMVGLPFDPDSLSPSARKERRQRRSVRQYLRVR